MLATITGCPGQEDLKVPISSSFSRIFLLGDGRAVCLGEADYRADEFSGQQINYYLLDSGGEMIVNRKISMAPRTDLGPASLAPNGDVLIAGMQWPHPQFPILSGFAMRLGVDSQTIWQKDDGDAFKNGFFAIKELGDGRVLAVGQGADSTRFIEINLAGEIVHEIIARPSRPDTAVISVEGQIVVVDTPVIESFNTDAALLWRSQVLEVPGRPIDFAGVFATANGDVVVLGAFEESPSLFLARINDEGNTIWSREIERDEIERDYASIAESGDGTLYLGGTNRLGQLDSDGNELWRKTVPGTIRSLSISVAGIVHAVGFRQVEEEGVLVSRMLLMKFDADGNLLSDQIFIGVSEE